MSKYYVKFDDSDLTSSSGLYAARDKDVLYDDMIKNVAVLDEDYFKLVDSIRDTGITVQKNQNKKRGSIKNLGKSRKYH